jgi:DNA-binding XRE family transcriptional regulator
VRDAGDDQVVITRAEYDELLALRAEKAARARPPEVAAMIAAGDRPLKAWRRYRGMTQQQLADQGAVSQGYLCDLEKGTKTASRETMIFLALALGRSVDTL